ncbi:hypothetical protein ACWMQM_004610, partial [Yersinia enterocolitica]
HFGLESANSPASPYLERLSIGFFINKRGVMPRLRPLTNPKDSILQGETGRRVKRPRQGP